MHVRIRKKHASDKSGCRVVGWLVGTVLHPTRSRCIKTPRAITPHYDGDKRRRAKRRHEQRVHECKQMEKWQQDVCASAQLFF